MPLTISRQNETRRSGVLPPVEHDLHWDPELAAAAGSVVASVPEWPALIRTEAVVKTPGAVADFYRAKFAVGSMGPIRQVGGGGLFVTVGGYACRHGFR